MNSRRAWLVFGAAVAAYIVSVLQRSSLGIAAVEATERFGILATTLSTLAVVQLIVYAGLQIPVGVLLDRVGPKRLLLAGAVLMVAGQTSMALAPDIGFAIVGRMLIGAGDAMTFISAMRLLSSWFSGPRLPLLSQLLGTTGQFGQVLSAFPLSFLLQQWGWTHAYLSAAALSVLMVVVVAMLVSDGAARPARRVPTETGPILLLRSSLRHPGTQLGFWAHFITQSSGTMFNLLWGFPFLSVGLGYGPAAASALVSLSVLSSAVSGPILGMLSARFPLRRSNLVLGIVIGMGAAWALVLGWPGQPPFPVVLLMLLVVSFGGPGSLIGFDYARSFNAPRSLGSATGIVNVGGFLAAFAMMLAVGILLDVASRTGLSTDLYAFDGFRLAFLVQYLVVGTGVGFFLHARRRTRRRMHEEEGIQVGPLSVALLRAWRRRRGRA